MKLRVYAFMAVLLILVSMVCTGCKSDCYSCDGDGTCGYCRGTNICKVCQGSGYNADEEGPYRCFICNGSGECGNCNGTDICDTCHGSGKY